MGWFIKFIDSSVGKKLVMALTGLFLFMFLIVHLIGNLLLLKSDGGRAFESYSKFMGNPSNIPIRVIEIGLFLLIFYHIINGIRLWIMNNKARKVSYYKVSTKENSTFFSRFMVQSGVIIGIFLVTHIKAFFVPYRIGDKHTMYMDVINAFKDPVISGFYLFAFLLLGFHLVHGVQSAFQTLGINNEKYTPALKGAGIVLSIIICCGFAIIPIYFLTGGK